MKSKRLIEVQYWSLVRTFPSSSFGGKLSFHTKNFLENNFKQTSSTKSSTDGYRKSYHQITKRKALLDLLLGHRISKIKLLELLQVVRILIGDVFSGVRLVFCLELFVFGSVGVHSHQSHFLIWLKQAFGWKGKESFVLYNRGGIKSNLLDGPHLVLLQSFRCWVF